ncbi:hypothetical protein Pan153_36020 [Gimesia panareensis]|uniref:YrhK domain-containing protein n=1 Tax=Gimesia panareensis TaxID=2527978 RepID=A0A518FRH1_9PLAN|nr:hypothetical protein [Gimesia panareensis]QDV18941.1 hypothetical protein Pan153_36020 [Gimesia panareensis]
MPESGQKSQGWECIESTGAPPFTTRRLFRHVDGTLREWLSRKHRKDLIAREIGLAEALGKLLVRCLWLPRELNWWIGSLFAVGALLFAAASALSLSPDLASALSLSATDVNVIYFAGSIPFTTAAYLQLYQAANAGALPDEEEDSESRRKLLGWKPLDAGWLSCALQFIGTILFNFNTLDALLPGLSWFETDLLVWIPNYVGSILFLASGYLAFIEICHYYWGWQPGNLSWWIGSINLLGCIGFMMSAFFAFTAPGPEVDWIVMVSVAFTLQGAICFFLGAVLMLPETVREEDAATVKQIPG